MRTKTSFKKGYKPPHTGVKGYTNRGSFKKGQAAWNEGRIVSKDYHLLHRWIRKQKGSANLCQNVACTGESRYFDWAKLPECAYEHKTENYIQLCRKCHKLMDVKKVKIVYVRI